MKKSFIRRFLLVYCSVVPGGISKTLAVCHRGRTNLNGWFYLQNLFQQAGFILNIVGNAVNRHRGP